MNIIFYICMFMLGMAFASFINASIYRIDNKFKLKEFLTKPSHCENCKRELTWYDLIPVIGYLLQRGKCSRCNKKINVYYPTSEIFLGISFLLFWIYGVPWFLWLCLLFMFVLSSYDIDSYSVPAKLVDWSLFVSILIWLILSRGLFSLIFPVSVFIFFSILNLIKKSMGMGDLLVLLSVGILLSYSQFISMFWIGILVALIYSIYLLLVKKENMKTAKVPMIPFFTVSFVIAAIYGEGVFQMLLKYMGI